PVPRPSRSTLFPYTTLFRSWTPNGVAICSAVGDQDRPYLVGDGAGGAIIVWYDRRAGDYDIYAQSVDAEGTPRWTPQGVAICSADRKSTRLNSSHQIISYAV